LAVASSDGVSVEASVLGASSASLNVGGVEAIQRAPPYLSVGENGASLQSRQFEEGRREEKMAGAERHEDLDLDTLVADDRSVAAIRWDMV